MQDRLSKKNQSHSVIVILTAALKNRKIRCSTQFVKRFQLFRKFNHINLHIIFKICRQSLFQTFGFLQSLVDHLRSSIHWRLGSLLKHIRHNSIDMVLVFHLHLIYSMLVHWSLKIIIKILYRVLFLQLQSQIVLFR